MTDKATVSGFGLIVVGNEILDGRRNDRHMTACLELLEERNISLAYTLFLPDEPKQLESQIRWAVDRPEPFFCCGGIGATPDDRTRACAAAAAGVELEMHAEGVDILKKRYGEKKATPPRLEMVRFPRGSTLIPNPINQVPGFRLRDGYFLPGFPEMARPMMSWVLDTYYEVGAVTDTRTLFVRDCGEADLAEMMRDFIASNPSVSFSSLPRMTKSGSILELGIRGPGAAVEKAHGDMIARLDVLGVNHHTS